MMGVVAEKLDGDGSPVVDELEGDGVEVPLPVLASGVPGPYVGPFLLGNLGGLRALRGRDTIPRLAKSVDVRRRNSPPFAETQHDARSIRNVLEQGREFGGSTTDDAISGALNELCRAVAIALPAQSESVGTVHEDQFGFRPGSAAKSGQRLRPPTQDDESEVVPCIVRECYGVNLEEDLPRDCSMWAYFE